MKQVYNHQNYSKEVTPRVLNQVVSDITANPNLEASWTKLNILTRCILRAGLKKKKEPNFLKISEFKELKNTCIFFATLKNQEIHDFNFFQH